MSNSKSNYLTAGIIIGSVYLALAFVMMRYLDSIVAFAILAALYPITNIALRISADRILLPTLLQKPMH